MSEVYFVTPQTCSDSDSIPVRRVYEMRFAHSADS